MTKPNFLIVGAAKAGTTALDSYLKQHPDIFLPDSKESRYFSNVSKKNLSPFSKKPHAKVTSERLEYFSQFEKASETAIGEASPDYLFYHEDAIKEIIEEIGNQTKIIIMLRNPVERAYSNYLHITRYMDSYMSLEDVIDNENDWISKNYWYGFYVTNPSYYYEAVKNYLQSFANVKVIIFEDFIKNTENVLIDVCKFLNVDSTFIFNQPSFTNKTGFQKKGALGYLFDNNFTVKKKIKNILIKLFGKKVIMDLYLHLKEKNMIKPEMKSETRHKLYKLFQEDVASLESLLGVDLSIWK